MHNTTTNHPLQSGTNFTYKPLFWILFTSLSLAATFFSYHYFPKAFTLLSLDLTMNREQALKKARELATKNHWLPSEPHEAVSFDTDSEFKNYIELQGGGVSKLQEIINLDLYTPYKWTVRHFQEHNPRETKIYFHPNGTPYGFTLTRAQADQGPALSSQDALSIAKNELATWNIDLQNYEAVETSSTTEPNGRVDHTFVYQDKRMGTKYAPFRLKLMVSGDTFSNLTQELKVPEAFKREFEFMRSANNKIALIATILLFLGYILIGSLGGLWILGRKEKSLYKPAAYTALFLSIVLAFTSLNNFPLFWMHYDTALSLINFNAWILIQILISAGVNLVMYFICIAAAENLTRKAFKHHPQLWSTWKNGAANSFTIAGRTVAGYLVATLDLAYVVAFYLLSSRFLGWWSPAETLANPNILATYIPSLGAVGQSLIAGFWEECIFRAVPLAGAALLGERFGKRRWWIAAALILQAVIFGAAHANYPAQPAYARLVELIIPSLMWGLIYLRYGLLTTIIAHFTYDVVWFSLPIFILHAPGALFQKILVIALTALPALIVAWQTLKNRGLTDTFHFTNNDWIYTNHEPALESQEETKEEPHQPSKYLSLKMGILSLCAGVAWLMLTPKNQDMIPLTITKNQALEKAREYFELKNIKLDSSWHATATTCLPENQDLVTEHLYVWKEHGPALYQKLLGDYLAPQMWKVRFALYEGDIAQRAQEYQLALYGDGKVWGMLDHLPEGKEGNSLSQHQAEAITDTALSFLGKNPNTLVKKAAQETKQPARTDWSITYQDPSIELVKEGQAQIKLEVAGDRLSSFEPQVLVPEEWTRTYRDSTTLFKLIATVTTLIILGLWLLLMYKILKNRISIKFWAGCATTVYFCLLALTALALMIPALSKDFKTSQPFYDQLFSTLGITLTLTLLWTLGAGILAGNIITWRFKNISSLGLAKLICYGSSLGLMYMTITTVLEKLIGHHHAPLWGDYAYLSSYWPSLSLLISTLLSWGLITLLFVGIFGLIDAYSNGCRRNTKICILLCILLGINIYAWKLSIHQSIIWWLTSGLIVGWFIWWAYKTVIQYNRAVIPWISSGYLTLFTLQNMLLRGSIDIGTLIVITLALNLCAFLTTRAIETYE